MLQKVILMDLDLTLLNSKQEISKHTVEVLEKCQKAGHLIGFSTSRGTTRIQRYVEQVKPDVIVCNAGASVFYKDKLIHEETFSLEETRTLFSSAYRLIGDDAEITVDTLNDFYWNRNDNKSTQYGNDAIYDDLKDFKIPAMKFCIQLTNAEIAKKIASSVNNCDFIPFSDIPWYKFAPKTATKENGILFLADYLNISTQNMISFGDDFSDIGMLKLCGTGVAMGNAIPQVKEIADAVTLSCDEDGIAVWLEKKLL